MDIENMKKNKAGIIVSAVALLIAGGIIFAQVDKNPNNDFGSIFQKKITLPAGAQVNASLNTTINSQSSNVGDVVVATVTSPVIVGENLLIPEGSKIYGKISYLERAVNEGEIKNGAIALSFDKVELLDGHEYRISGTVPLRRADYTTKTVSTLVKRTGREKVASGVKDTVLGAAAGAALGTAVGAIAGGGRGAGRGAWSGAAIGGGLGATKGVYSGVTDKGRIVSTTVKSAQELILQSGDEISVTLEKPLQAIALKLG